MGLIKTIAMMKGGVTYSAEVQAVINRFIAAGQPLTQTEITTKVQPFVDGMVADGNWQYIDEFWWSKGIETKAKSFVGFKSLIATEVGTVTFGADGWSGFTTSDFIKSGYIPSSFGGQFTLNNAMLGAYFTASPQNNATVIGTQETGAVHPARLSSGALAQGLNTFNLVSAGTALTIDSLKTYIRLDSTHNYEYINGALTLSPGLASGGLSTYEIYIGCLNNNGAASSSTTSNIGCALIGAAVGVDQAKLNSRIATLLS